MENRAINLAISTTKLTARSVIAGVRKYLQHRSRVKAQKAAKNQNPHGKQTVKQLIGQNQGVSSIEIANTEIRDFERIARKYGVDFAIVKDKKAEQPKYTVFFKARDADALTSAFKEYSAKIMQKEKKPSVLKQLAKLKELVAGLPQKVKERNKEREL